MGQAEEYLSLVRVEMGRAVSPAAGAPDHFYASMRYALGWMDERFRPTSPGAATMLRPRLCLLACEAAGGDARAAVPAAAAVELLHNFTLVHDDIQDNSPQRRHRPSVWKLVGVPLAINSGDGLFAAAHLALERLAEEGLTAETVLSSVRELDLVSLRIWEGQHMDLSFERRASVSLEEYLAMIARKTGALMGLSCYLGALVAGRDPGSLRAFRDFGEQLGLAYQIRDDLRGVWQDEATTGKREMEDIYGRKKGYPAVRALELASGGQAARLTRVYASEEVKEEDATWVRELMTSLGIPEEGHERARAHVSRAVESLDRAGAGGPARRALEDVAREVLG